MQKTERVQTRAKQKSYEPTPLDYLLLSHVKEYHFLTAWQVVKIHFSDSSLTRAQTKLKTLYEQGYLERRALPHEGKGQPTYIYYLSTQGQHALAEDPTSVRRVRKSNIEHMKYPHLEHVLHVNDLLIAARRLHSLAPDITLETMRHDLDLKREPVRVTYSRRMSEGDRDDETVSIVPDAWLDFRLQLANSTKKRRKCIVLELDRGSETYIPDFKKKIRAYVHYAIENGPYFQKFGTNSITVAYVTTAGENRLKNMVLWCEQELQAQQLHYEAPLFRFAALPKDSLDPQKGLDPKKLFLSEMWYTPYTQEPGTLLWKP